MVKINYNSIDILNYKLVLMNYPIDVLVEMLVKEQRRIQELEQEVSRLKKLTENANGFEFNEP